MTNNEESRFLDSLVEEKLKSQEYRGNLVIRKLSWVTGLFALSAIRLPIEIDLQMLLYLVPIIALVFDLYILGENFGIKRIGAFVKDKYPKSPEAQWERWLAGRRDRFSWYALPLSTSIIVISCAALLFITHPNMWFWGIWLVLVIAAGAGLYLYTDKVVLKALDRITQLDST